ncbi:Thymidylate synthase ThyX [Syntrophomonas zehnderi OL-4]|uniref:FAD-dependent thymidylate synthase n=1 Tax=Syntrophomonas zehnderi OL-4 TaxID=690567 RepID=A0A0E4G934_9FIRM|nr:FAD-dependent thymidylate synthase [Syntrophomonas zehnderi]CFX04050.1 Thymidylate synthase ThyX [Syntrophomonas zehnderi OL-4]
MIIIKPQIYVPQDALSDRISTRLERYARVCYKSEDKMSSGGNPDFLKSKVRMGHESIIEHEKATVMLIIDRGVSHELVRHRVGAAYSQESTRYCSYNQDKFGNEITVIEPYFLHDKPEAYALWLQSCQVIEKNYMQMLAQGCSAQEARSVLPNSLKTEIVVTFNMREWRHFFRLRCDQAAHPQMRQVAIPLLLFFKEKLPELFEDIEFDRSFPARHYAELIITDDLFTI